MDKTIEIIVVVLVLMLTAGIIMALLGFRVGPFTEFLDNQMGGASCDINETKYRNACDCDANPQETDEASKIKSNSQCEWTGDVSCSADVCN